jgi:hypothetical protein
MRIGLGRGARIEWRIGQEVDAPVRMAVIHWNQHLAQHHPVSVGIHDRERAHATI